MLAVEGIPVFYLELAIGQRLRKGAIGAWNLISVYAGGIGVASAVVSFNVALYYNTIIAWCIFYFYHSFKNPLPWTDCPPKKLLNDTYVDQPECEVCLILFIFEYMWISLSFKYTLFKVFFKLRTYIRNKLF
jgi:solute carrier family 6 amino acid/orphan transporter-like 15/16/17/18/20